MGNLLGTKEVAAIAGVSAKTICRWADEGLIEPAQVTLGGWRRFTQDEVDRLLASLEAPR